MPKITSDLRYQIKLLPILGPILESGWRRLTGRRDLCFTLMQSPLLSDNACIVKIGANDGAAGDPIGQLLIRRPAMRCVFVEPVTHLLDRARNIWGNSSRFTYVNAAINDGSPATFFYLDPLAREQLPNLEIDPDQLGSFDRMHILKHPGSERLTPYIRSMHVKGMTLDTLLRYAQVNSLDLLHIDTEGWDWKILSQLDLDRWHPAHILFEHIHLAEIDKNSARNYLSACYNIEIYGTDWLCSRKTIVP